MPATQPEVNASANPFSGMSMGAVATIYTAWTMVGVRWGEQRTKRPTLSHLQVFLKRFGDPTIAPFASIYMRNGHTNSCVALPNLNARSTDVPRGSPIGDILN